MNNDNAILKQCLAQPVELLRLIDLASNAIVSKTIIDRPAGTITLFAFDRGQRLSEHTSPFDAVVQILEGKALITIGTASMEISAGQLIVMPAGVPHALAAVEPFKMMLIMVRGQSDARQTDR
ncbi:MAG: cupin domain-containing protein [Sedimentisphaerales bacterium]|jgi:quercetin dioxygenase-like cupin family protein|nr:cupin domain-containing protein [Sedimentisphaerales bacterium]